MKPLATAPEPPIAPPQDAPAFQPKQKEDPSSDSEHSLLGLDSITLIYDPETGVIHSAEAEGGELFYDDEGPYGDDRRGDVQQHDREGRRKGEHAEERREGDDDLAAIDGLRDLVKSVSNSQLSRALKLCETNTLLQMQKYADRERRRGAAGGAQREGEGEGEGDAIVVPGDVAVDGLEGLLAAINRGIKRESDLPKSGSDSKAKDPLAKYLEKLGGAADRKGEAYQVLVSGISDEMQTKFEEAERFADSENARLSKSFNRKYEDEEGEQHPGSTLEKGRARDEL